MQYLKHDPEELWDMGKCLYDIPENSEIENYSSDAAI